MDAPFPWLEDELSAGVSEFWRLREEQGKTQKDGDGVQDTGMRSSVTGGKHLGPIEQMVVRIFRECGVPAAHIHAKHRNYLPGYYRESKNWDIVVHNGVHLIAVVEFKSQVGSFGNNQNNRIEEAIGQAVDLWKLSEADGFGPLPAWFAYFMLLEDSPKVLKPVRKKKMIVDPLEVFQKTSYVDRYQLAFQRMRRERLLDAAALIVADKEAGGWRAPSPDLSIRSFATAIAARVAWVDEATNG